MNNDKRKLYHEKQIYMRCGLHALNNYLQGRVFESKDFDEIAAQLAPDTIGLNPHKSIFGIGNYNVDVLTMALMKKGYNLDYFDKRKTFDLLTLESIDGILLNIPISSWMGLWQSRHWFSIRMIDGVYYNLDSKLGEPQAFESPSSLVEYLTTLQDTTDLTILTIKQEKMSTDIDGEKKMDIVE